MLQVEPTGQRGRTATVAGAASKPFARWPHHRYAPSNCRQRGGGGRIVSPRHTLLVDQQLRVGVLIRYLSRGYWRAWRGCRLRQLTPVVCRRRHTAGSTVDAV